MRFSSEEISHRSKHERSTERFGPTSHDRMEPLKTRSHQVHERVENMSHKVHCSFAKMSVDEKGKCITIYRLYACLKAICNVKRSIGNLFFKSSFSERMIQVASTGIFGW